MEFFEFTFDDLFVAMREGNDNITNSSTCRDELIQVQRQLSPRGNLCRKGFDDKSGKNGSKQPYGGGYKR